MQHAADPFRALYDANHARVTRMLGRLVGPQDAEDLAQTVFAKAAKALPGFRGEASSSTWLYRIAANVASDWLRGRASHEAAQTVPLADAANDETADAGSSAAEADTHPTPEQQMSQHEMQACIRREIGKLPEQQRMVFMLSALGGLADDEIACMLGISWDNAKVRLHRARKAFKQVIAARCDFYRDELSCKPASPECCSPPSATAMSDRS